MAVNNEYIRLNRFKREDRYWIQEVPEKSVPVKSNFAYDLSLNPTKGEIVDYQAINASILMIILSNFGEHPFRPNLGSSAQNMPFESFQLNQNYDGLAGEIERIETRIKVLDITVEADPDNHSLKLNIPYMVLNTGEVAEFDQRLSM